MVKLALVQSKLKEMFGLNYQYLILLLEFKDRMVFDNGLDTGEGCDRACLANGFIWKKIHLGCSRIIPF